MADLSIPVLALTFVAVLVGDIPDKRALFAARILIAICVFVALENPVYFAAAFLSALIGGVIVWKDGQPASSHLLLTALQVTTICIFLFTAAQHTTPFWFGYVIAVGAASVVGIDYVCPTVDDKPFFNKYRAAGFALMGFGLSAVNAPSSAFNYII